MFVSLDDRSLAARVTKLGTLPSVAYERQAPATVWFCDGDTERAYGREYLQSKAQLPPQHLYRVLDAEVRGKGAITLDRRLVRENLEGAPVDALITEIAREAAPSECAEHPVLYAMRYGVKNYGHWLTDILPRIIWFREQYRDVKIVVHRETPRQILEALRLSGVAEASWFRLGDQHVRLPEMYFAGLWNRHPLVHTPLTFEYLQQVRRQALSKRRWQFRRAPKKLFVTRTDARTRQVENHADLSRFLKAKGFTAVATGNMSFVDQVRLFAAAEEIVGVSGAALTNMVFSESGTRLLNLSPASMPSLYFWDIAHHAKVQYSIAYFPSSLPQRGIHSDFSVDIDVVGQMTAG